jgi:hypothetical protein
MRSGCSRAPRLWTGRALAALACYCGALAPPSTASAQTPSVAISRPQAEETVLDNTGAVPVALTLQGVALTASNRLRVLIDGKAHGGDRRALESTVAFTIDHVERGTHTLQVQLIDPKDALIAASPVVTFHLWQASALLPNRTPPKSAPR